MTKRVPLHTEAGSDEYRAATEPQAIVAEARQRIERALSPLLIVPSTQVYDTRHNCLWKYS